MKQIVLFSFKKSQIRGLLKKLDMEINKERKVVYKETGETVGCYICGGELKEDRVGNILPGTNAILCDNPSCFVEYSIEKGMV